MNYSKKINAYVLPLIATNIIQIIIGQLSLHFAVSGSSTALSGITIIQNLLFAFGGILGAFSLSFNIKGSRAHNMEDRDRFYDLLKSSLIIDLIIGFIFIVFSIFFGSIFLEKFYSFDGVLLEESKNYLLIMSPYILLTLLSFLFTNLLKVEQKTKPIFWIGFVSSIIDVLLNYLLVPRLGIKGAALSAIISLLLIIISYFSLIYPLVFMSIKIKSTCKRELIKFGIPLTIQEVLESVLFIMIFDALMGRQGLVALSSYAVISQLFGMAKIPAFTYAGAVSIFLPEAEKGNNTSEFMRTIYRNSLLVSSLFSVLAILSANKFSQFLAQDIKQNLIPVAIYTFIIMGATPLYETSKMYLQCDGHENLVVKYTSIVNILGIIILLLIQLLGFQSYYSLYAIFGLTLFILTCIFMRKINLNTIKLN
ncbi:sodium transporter [Floricoccus tropicus]|uniref:Probable multidrug resistance protein NorM n=1 Tax=Floricoccus tropicus TaxID=1859473 RepID=A0A1E8GJT9_9LACT|nr:MATE family efflux transporter [Floricoccus tropicus]OFI48500.1 sodium transporter [Floricoccus tropicus]